MTIGHVLGARGQTCPVLATAAGGAVGKWWLGPWPGFPLAAAIPPVNCMLAYRAVNTPGSVWGAGPTNLAESYVNLNTPGTRDAYSGSGNPVWDITGWLFNGASIYLKTGLFINDNYSFLIQYATQAPTMGAIDGVNYWGFQGSGITTGYFEYKNYSGNYPIGASGNVGIDGSPTGCYLNGADVTNITVTTQTLPTTLEIYIGRMNRNNTATNGTACKIKAIAVYNIQLDSNRMAALGTVGTGAMAAL
jgi:hypothetical protein